MLEKCTKIIIFTFDKYKHMRNVVRSVFQGRFAMNNN